MFDSLLKEENIIVIDNENIELVISGVRKMLDSDLNKKLNVYKDIYKMDSGLINIVEK